MIDFKRIPEDENNEYKYLWRVGSAIESGTAGLTWDEAAPLINKEWRSDESKYRTESAYRKPVQYAMSFYDNVFSKLSDDEQIKALKQIRVNIAKEKIKVQTEKLEYQRWLREDARDEMFEEEVLQSIKNNLNKQEPPKKIEVEPAARYGLLNIADIHFGKDFRIYGLNDEIINEYSPEIFKYRMQKLFCETVDYAKKEGLSSIKMFNLGDSLDGFLRNQQLWTLRYGVVDSANIFGEYMGKWLRELSKSVAVEYHQTVGNHGELRLLDGKKGGHLNENIEIVTNNIIRLINEDNPNFSMVTNKTGLIFTPIAGFNVLGIHGEVANLSQALKEYSDIYNVPIHYVVAGHKHHSEFTNCGVRKGTIGVGSIVGSDDFSMKLRRAADATASFVTFEEFKGKTDEHTFVLN